jgi:hypothetical protein
MRSDGATPLQTADVFVQHEWRERLLSISFIKLTTRVGLRWQAIEEWCTHATLGILSWTLHGRDTLSGKISFQFSSAGILFRTT